MTDCLPPIPIMKRVLNSISHIFEIATTILFINVLICVFLQILFRYIIKISVPWTEEGARYLFVWMVFIGSVATFAKDQNIKLTILSGKLPQKAETILEIFAYSGVIVFCIILFRGSILMAKLNWHLPSLTMERIYVGYLFVSSILSCFMIIIFSVVHLVEKVRAVCIH